MGRVGSIACDTAEQDPFFALPSKILKKYLRIKLKIGVPLWIDYKREKNKEKERSERRDFFSCAQSSPVEISRMLDTRKKHDKIEKERER